MRPPFRSAYPLLLLAGLAACSHGSAPPPRSAAASPAPTAIDAAAELLNQGDSDGARKRLKPILKADPMNPAARLLSDSIERDPIELLGPNSYPYVTRPGDTMTGLAERFLGNRLKAYQLARYNGIAKPAALAPGQTLRIPGEPPRPAPAPRPAPPRESVREPAREAAKPARPARPAPPAAPARPAANPAAARAARAAGLAALNGGNVAGAVGLLRRAAALDPNNPAIAADLSRAQRIYATVRARR